MRFVHIGDLHLGKWICGHSFINEQREVLFELLEWMNEHHIAYLVLAGDIYDRLVPPVEAVELFDDFLTTAITKYKITILAISGNHDSDERLHFGSALLQKNGLMMAAKLKEEWMTYEIPETNVVFHLLPFIKPSQVKELYDISSIKTYQEALELVVNQHPIDDTKINILVTHQFVAGKQAVIQSESETILSVGGSEVVDVHLFDAYDYVALGHLHASQKVSRDTVRYSGSILRYSFDEVKQNKGFLVIDVMDKDHIEIEQYPFHPSKTLRKYQGHLEDFLDQTKTPVENINDYIAFDLLDQRLIAHAMDKLREYYPNALQLTYTMLEDVNASKSAASPTFRKMTDMDLFQEFFEIIRERPLKEEEQEVVATLFEKVRETDETH